MAAILGVARAPIRKSIECKSPHYEVVGHLDTSGQSLSMGLSAPVAINGTVGFERRWNIVEVRFCYENYFLVFGFISSKTLLRVGHCTQN